MPLTFVVQPVIEGAENSTWLFIIIRGEAEGEHEIVATGEVFEDKQAALTAASAVARDCQALRLHYEINHVPRTDEYVARIIDRETGALIARSANFSSEEEMQAGMQRLFDECQEPPTLAVVGND